MKAMEYNTLNGSVVTGENWQYIGKFGQAVLNHIIKLNAMSDNVIKQQVLNAHIEQYSRKVGGVTIINKTSES